MKESTFKGVGGLNILNDVDKEVVMADINDWIDARVPAIRTKSAAL